MQTNKNGSNVIGQPPLKFVITEEELNAKNERFFHEKEQEITRIFKRTPGTAFYRIFITEAIKAYNNTGDSSYFNMYLRDLLQPHLYSFFRNHDQDFHADLRSSYKDLEYLWITVEDHIVSGILSHEFDNFDQIIPDSTKEEQPKYDSMFTIIPKEERVFLTVRNIDPLLEYHDSDTIDTYASRRDAYEKEHGIVMNPGRKLI